MAAGSVAPSPMERRCQAAPADRGAWSSPEGDAACRVDASTQVFQRVAPDAGCPRREALVFGEENRAVQIGTHLPRICRKAGPDTIRSAAVQAEDLGTSVPVLPVRHPLPLAKDPMTPTCRTATRLTASPRKWCIANILYHYGEPRCSGMLFSWMPRRKATSSSASTRLRPPC